MHCLFLFRLQTIHNANFIHRDFHSGNILLSDQKCQIGDLGLSQPENNTSPNNEIYGVIPYVAPEIFNGANFSKKSDIYSMGMIMWELTTGCKPFANLKHDHKLIYEIIDGKRPEITNDTPEWFANLMKRCWDSDPTERPTITEIHKIFSDFIIINEKEFEQAEERRLELIGLKELGPEFNEAIYISRALNSLISVSSINLTSLNIKKGRYLS